MSYIQDIIESNFDVYNQAQIPRRYYRVNCPLCEDVVGRADEGGHLHLFVDRGLSSWGHCFKCGSHKPVRVFLAKVGVIVDAYSSLEQQQDLKDQIKEIITGVEESLSLVEPPEIEIEEELCRIPDLPDRNSCHRMFLLLEKWKLDPIVLDHLGWRWSMRNQAFYFLVHMGGKLVYYQWRDITGRRQSCSGDFSRYGILGNWDCDLKEQADIVYLVEGPKDAAALYQSGKWGVVLHGHSLDPYQRLRLEALPHEKVILLDSDVTVEAKEMGAVTGWKVSYLPDGDPADHSCNIDEGLLGEQSLSGFVKQLLHNKQVGKRVKH